MRSCLSGWTIFSPLLLFSRVLPALTVMFTCLVQNSATPRPATTMHAIQDQSWTLESILRGFMQASC